MNAMNTKLPFWLHAEDVEIEKYFPYDHVVLNQLFTFERDEIPHFFYQLQGRFEDSLYVKWPDMFRKGAMDNKSALLVFIHGAKFFIGFYDGTWSIGLGIRSLTHNEPKAYIVLNKHDKEVWEAQERLT